MNVLVLAQMICGYIVWAIVLATYGMPWLRRLGRDETMRAIATLHSFRFLGLVFVIPNVVGTIPPAFAVVAGWADFATAILAATALISYGNRRAFWTFALLFNVVGIVDLTIDTIHGIQLHIQSWAGQLGPAYFIPIAYVPLLMITHVVAFSLLLRRSTNEP